MPSTTITSSSLRRICRCTIFLTLFLMFMDSRLRPAFLSLSKDSGQGNGHHPEPVQNTLSRQKRAAIFDTETVISNQTKLIRNARQKPNKEEIEDAEPETDDPAAGEDSEKTDPDGEDAEQKEEETEEDATTTVKSRHKTTKRTVVKTTTPARKKSTHTSHKGKEKDKHVKTDKDNDNGDDDDDEEDDKDDKKHSHSTHAHSHTSVGATVYGHSTTEEPIKEPECTIPAIRQFPPDMFDQKGRRYGGLLVHILVVVYMFLCLAVVCDDYFCGSLETVCKRLNLSEDVAGATLMAAGSSAPELFASLIGVFVAKGDVGTGTIVGSAVFNVLFVVGTCAFFSGTEGTQLSWWPIMRDTGFYSISIAVLIASIADGEVTWYESLIMLIFYGIYVCTMKFNTRAFEWVSQKTGWSGPVQGVEESARLSGGGRFDKPVFSGYEQFADEADNFQDHEAMSPHPHKQSSLSVPSNEKVQWHQRNSFEVVHEEFEKWRVKPQPGSGKKAFARWIVMYPIYFVLYYTIPDCKKERFAKWYLATFFLSIAWIAVFSYIMVWMVTIMGHTMNIPDSIMGITFLAAGTSIPDAMASLIVARQGMIDMAVSNSIGSNVFDILIGLALPWFLSTSMVRPGHTVRINSNGLVYNAVLLFVTVAIALGGLRSTGWRLTRRVGTIFYITYGIYLILAVMIEYNVFGFVNPRMCNDEEADLKEHIMAKSGQ
ncbi:sodium/potassium/calcium exchanger 4-like [Paramacrobiotus metropolitanus]|uniref:sodium/potassium/calcium exchanger 4-like n=1 Tax=Paramacrobiotus metropolitanus TaxID=2943436 RepID=UPI002446437D|nr:sodium/potassium/calcium exchanger 4-like [Paramacrobiotus metropolitanus]